MDNEKISFEEVNNDEILSKLEDSFDEDKPRKSRTKDIQTCSSRFNSNSELTSNISMEIKESSKKLLSQLVLELSPSKQTKEIEKAETETNGLENIYSNDVFQIDQLNPDQTFNESVTSKESNDSIFINVFNDNNFILENQMTSSDNKENYVSMPPNFDLDSNASVIIENDDDLKYKNKIEKMILKFKPKFNGKRVAKNFIIVVKTFQGSQYMQTILSEADEKFAFFVYSMVNFYFLT